MAQVPAMLFLFFLAHSCSNRMDEISAVTYKDTLPVESARDVEMVYSDSAIIKASVKSPQVNRYAGENPYIIMPSGLTLLFYDSVMNVRTRLTALYAMKYLKTDMLEARNNVVVINHLGEKLNTEHLVWDQKNQKIYSEVFVKITTPEKVLYGDGLDADESFDKWAIRKPKGTFYIHMDDEEE
jgi:LPS export ABC transporter protein LptC